MKKCPTCGKEFDDSMRFCQIDGTLLVDDQPPLDPYATMIGHKWDLTPAETTEESVESAPAEEERLAEPDEVLDLPITDPLRTMYVSETELKEALGGQQKPMEPANDEPEIDAGLGHGFNMPPTPPPSPFVASDAGAETVVVPPFKDPEPARAAEWTPPVSDSAWQDQQIGSGVPFQPLSAGVVGQNKTLAIVSLVSGIAGFTLCCGMFIPSIVAVVTGIMARKQIRANPSEFGGEGLALAGIILGGVGLVAGIPVFIIIFVGQILQIFFGASMNQ